ncbi:MAG: hypothetical protein OXF02_00465, partial [Simkaniaceae bacterium]|nr:hypothetical protein [Simkaniaceae bacterium]
MSDYGLSQPSGSYGRPPRTLEEYAIAVAKVAGFGQEEKLRTKEEQTERYEELEKKLQDELLAKEGQVDKERQWLASHSKLVDYGWTGGMITAGGIGGPIGLLMGGWILVVIGGVFLAKYRREQKEHQGLLDKYQKEAGALQ